MLKDHLFQTASVLNFESKAFGFLSSIPRIDSFLIVLLPTVFAQLTHRHMFEHTCFTAKQLQYLSLKHQQI